MKTLLFALLLTTTAFAHLGETEEQLRKRLGEPAGEEKAEGAQVLTFKVGKRVAAIWIVERTVSREVHSDITSAEAMKLRDAQGTAWKETMRAGNLTMWKSAEGFHAFFDTDMFVLNDGRMDALDKERKKKEPVEKAKGK